MKNFKKIIASVIAASCVAGTFAFSASETGERVTVIVELKGDAVLEDKKAQEMGAKLFCVTDEAADMEDSIRQTQAIVQSDIREKVDNKAKTGYTYTHVLNGFSMEVNEADIASIKALPNVENVYISQTFELCDEPDSGEGMYIDSGCEMMHMDYMHENGYTGKGTVIAIVDNGFDVGHENFQGPIEEPKLSKKDIADTIENEKLSISSIDETVTANRVYYSEKIPYIYNYKDKTSDTLDPLIDHGQHVAGIAAGNNGTDPKGGKFVGAAPDAQLLLMSCGSKGQIDLASAFAAIDDAVKLGADAINGSFSSPLLEGFDVESKVINNTVKAGILYSSSAGNDGRSVEGVNPLAVNIDYSTSGIPNSYTTATSVANINNNNRWKICYEMTVGGNTIDFGEENKSVSFAEKFSDKQYDYVYVGEGGKEDFNKVDVKDKIAIIRRTSMTFEEKVTNAMNAGAIGMIFVNNEDVLDIGVSKESVRDMPCACVSPVDLDKLTGAAEKKLQTNSELLSSMITTNDFTMANNSSWGTNSSLELKPEITAPGGRIYSSVYNDKYKNMSGTSMATPHMTGAAAVMSQYIQKHPEKYGKDINKAHLIENLIMTSADVVMQDKENDIPYSPRNQGAGLINLEKAAKTPVTLIGDTYTIDDTEIEKSKISLREIEDTFTVEFTARNLTDTEVVYDSAEMTVITDSADEDGYVSDMKKLTFKAQLPKSVTVPAHGETKVSIPVSLDKAELSENEKVFKNGFYIDGFVFLDNTVNEDIPQISIPFTGFYGDWNSAPVLDKTNFSGESLYGNTYLHCYTKRLSDGSCSDKANMEKSGINLFFKGNEEDKAEYDSENFVGYSPNGDGFADTPGGMVMVLRKLGSSDVLIYDAEGNEVYSQSGLERDKLSSLFLVLDEGKINAFPDGDYTLKFKTGFYRLDPYEQNESVELKFYLDREKPVITSLEKGSDGKELTVAASDNRHIMGFVLGGTKNGEAFTEAYPIKGHGEAEHTFNIEGVDEGSLFIEAVDYAQNSAKISEAGLLFEFSGKTDSSFLFNVYNTTGHTINAAVTMALYSEGSLVGIAADKNALIPDGNSYESFTIGSNVRYDTIKLFVWDSLNGMTPLYRAFEF